MYVHNKSPLYQIIHFNVSTWFLKPLNIKWDRFDWQSWIFSIITPVVTWSFRNHFNML